MSLSLRSKGHYVVLVAILIAGTCKSYFSHCTQFVLGDIKQELKVNRIVHIHTAMGVCVYIYISLYIIICQYMSGWIKESLCFEL